MIRLIALIAVVMTLVAVGAVPTFAQDASPAASSGAAACDAPELPPGTPTPMDEATPEASAGEDLATPEGEAGEEEGTEFPPAPAGTPTSGAAADEATAALENLVGCINAGEYLSVGALATEDFIQNFIEVPTVYDVPSTFEDVQPVEIRLIDGVQSYDDGSFGVDWVYAGLFNGPGALSSERWFFQPDDGILKLANVMPIPVPAAALPENATVVEVKMVDYAFALSQTTIPAGPVVFRTVNDSASGAAHVNVLVTLREGTTAAQVIQSEVDVDEIFEGFYGAVFLEPGQSGDLAFESMEPGTYFLVCDVETDDGTPHFDLGMVAEITVE